MNKVITYGTFDLFHIGHLKLLKRAKALGDHLTVVISTDEFNWNHKQKKCAVSYEDRAEIIKSINCVDEVIPENNWEQKVSDVIDNDIQTFVMGDDWKGKFDFLAEHCQVIYLARTDGVSTTEIKEQIKKGADSSTLPC